MRIHPFTDGNGRSTRLIADLVFIAAQLAGAPDDAVLMRYDWRFDKGSYISLLRKYDADRDPTDLAGFVPVQPL